MNSNTQERFPIITIFCLVFLGWHISLAVVYFLITRVPPSHAVSVALARVFVSGGLPASSIIPLVLEGRTYSALDWLRAANTPSGAATLRASDWLLFHIPIVSLFLTLLSMLTVRRWRKKRAPKLLRGVQVIRR